VALGLFACFAVALFMRRAYIEVMGGHEDYVQWALRHYFGGCIAPPFIPGGPWPLSTPMGYPLLRFAADALGIGALPTLRSIQAAFDAAAVVPIYLVLRRLGARRAAALLGPALFAVLPLFAAGCTFTLPESPCVAIIAWLLLLVAGVLERPRVGGAIAIGAVVAVLTLLRSEMLLLVGGLPAVVMVAADATWRRRVACAAAIMLTAALLLAPIGIGQGIHNGRFLVTSNCGGYALYCGLGQVPSRHGIVVNDAYWGTLLQARGILWHSDECDAYFRREFRAIVAEDPGLLVRNVLYRWGRIIFDAESLEFTPRAGGRLQNAMNDATPVAIAIALVILLARKEPGRLRRAIVLALPIAYALASIGLVYYEPRYVRYAQLSGVLALPVVVDAIGRALAARAPRGGDPAAHARRVTIIGGLALFAALAAAALPGIVALAGRVADARAAAAWREGRLTGAALDALAALPWKMVSSARLERGADAELIELVTDEGAATYQMVAHLAAAGARALGVVADVEVVEGGVTIGALAGGRWIVTDSATEPGRRRLSLFVPARGVDRLELIVANCRPPGGSSRVRFHAFTVTTITDVQKDEGGAAAGP
jgi:hypothetical protein